jgi:hypothetical protein
MLSPIYPYPMAFSPTEQPPGIFDRQLDIHTISEAVSSMDEAGLKQFRLSHNGTRAQITTPSGRETTLELVGGSRMEVMEDSWNQDSSLEKLCALGLRQFADVDYYVFLGMESKQVYETDEFYDSIRRVSTSITHYLQGQIDENAEILQTWNLD